MQVTAVISHEPQMLLKTIGRASGGEVWLVSGLGFDVVLGG